jgi:hypothetical protein
VLVQGAQLFVDTEFCDQTIASTTARPGGLANGSPTSAASGTTAAAAATNSTTLLATGGSLYGIPTATTAAIGNKVLLFDASQLVCGDDPTGVVIDT